jgi:hypothetical protein
MLWHKSDPQPHPPDFSPSADTVFADALSLVRGCRKVKKITAINRRLREHNQTSV